MNNTKNGKKLGKKIAGGIVRFGEGLKEGYEEEKAKTKPAKKKTTRKPAYHNGKKLGKAVMSTAIEVGKGAKKAYLKESKVPTRKPTKKKKVTKRKKRTTKDEWDYFF